MAESLTPAMFALLLALTEGERHGYALTSDAERLSGGSVVLGPGTLYRSLQRMRVDGLIEEMGVDQAAVHADRRAERRRRYRITPAGRTAVRTEAHRLTALLSSDTAQALLRAEPARFHRAAFGADELLRHHGPDGRITHCELLVNGGRLLLHDDYSERRNETPTALGGTPVTLHLCMAEVDAVSPPRKSPAASR